MEDENKKPDAPPETQSGFPQKKIVYVIIAIAIIILAIVLIAKFGYNVDLLNPASGEMSIAGHQFTANREFPTPTTERQAYNANFTVTPTMTFGYSAVPEPVGTTYDSYSGSVVEIQYAINNLENTAQTGSDPYNKTENITKQVMKSMQS
jgi:hypothetical protein